MTPLMMYPPWIEQMVRRASAARPAASAALRPLAVTVGVVAAGAMSLAPAHADPSADPITGVLSGAGTGGNGSFSDTIAGIGQSLCPMLVQPGAQLATIASQLSGKPGLPPDMVGSVASMAIQMECPGVMTSLANGQMPSGLPGLGGNSGMSLPFQLPGAGGAPGSPLQLPGLSPAAPSPLQLPGLAPAAPNPPQLPGVIPVAAGPQQVPVA
ncbi:DUF732 domain-containing protein [Mycobacterium helveticum]|uniref:DUF732 domain-containing protein n=1 Tax=Mycobacterium helveticum TaxID=2592811 RepID=A0A557XQ70_9MYCO|nr:DUF732 domain-containing protein [Mycobacterium helveticum]TVS85450.1 DUF732 domain-containing protein [Mycobacterium helveticum]TVS88057.1 DUF732 domain-containing protein [Mycobacterium helveticum]